MLHNGLLAQQSPCPLVWKFSSSTRSVMYHFHIFGGLSCYYVLASPWISYLILLIWKVPKYKKKKKKPKTKTSIIESLQIGSGHNCWSDTKRHFLYSVEFLSTQFLPFFPFRCSIFSHIFLIVNVSRLWSFRLLFSICVFPDCIFHVLNFYILFVLLLLYKIPDYSSSPIFT